MLAIRKWGNSQGIRIPKKYLQELNLDIGDQLNLVAINNQFILTPIRKQKRKSKLRVSDVFKDDLEIQQYEWETVGREIW